MDHAVTVGDVLYASAAVFGAILLGFIILGGLVIVLSVIAKGWRH